MQSADGIGEGAYRAGAQPPPGVPWHRRVDRNLEMKANGILPDDEDGHVAVACVGSCTRGSSPTYTLADVTESAASAANLARVV